MYLPNGHKPRCRVVDILEEPPPDSSVVSLTTPKAVVGLFKGVLEGRGSEELWVAVVNGRLSPLALQMVAKGRVNSVNCELRELFRLAITMNAAGLFVAHNHPSGNLEFSQEDRAFSDRVSRFALELGLTLYDSVIIAGRKGRSLKEGMAETQEQGGYYSVPQQ